MIIIRFLKLTNPIFIISMYFHLFDKSNIITGAIHCTISLQQSSQLLAILIPWLLLRLTSTFVIVIIRCSIIINVIMDFYRKSSPIHSDSRYVSSSDLVKTTLSGNGIHFSAQPTSQDIGSVNVSEKPHQKSVLNSDQ